VAWCRTHQPHEPQSSPLGRAIRYLLSREAALRRSVTGSCPSTTVSWNDCTSVRLTRKILLFADSDTGGERAAIACSVLGSCELADVNPVEYLADVLPRLARGARLRELADLLSARWKAARNTATA
jgi:transposase